MADELKEKLELHCMWLRGDLNGIRANLRGADLRGADLRGADLCEANLSEADLCGANLREADLRGADLRGADLCEANLSEADLCGANLSGADLRGADLRGADLRLADLREANLSGSNLSGANLYTAKGFDSVVVSNSTLFWHMQCPEKGSYTAYKKSKGGLIVELLIPDDALRSSATSRKCRASKAKVISITNPDGTPAGVHGVRSYYDASFWYRVGETVEVSNFSENRWNECAPGIHHFITWEEAVLYKN